ncbi:MAG: ABC transporter substrate-binding protein, partial [Pseudomonadota bacterium]
QRLTAGGVTIREFPDTVWDAMGTASQQVYDENMSDDLFKTIFDSVQTSMRASSEWLTRSEGAYRNQRDRVLG